MNKQFRRLLICLVSILIIAAGITGLSYADTNNGYDPTTMEKWNHWYHDLEHEDYLNTWQQSEYWGSRLYNSIFWQCGWYDTDTSHVTTPGATGIICKFYQMYSVHIRYDDNAVYNGSPHGASMGWRINWEDEQAGLPTSEGVTMSADTPWLYEGTGNTVYNSPDPPTNAGTYKVTAAIDIEEDPKTPLRLSTSEEFEIRKKPVTVTWTYDGPYEYNGEKQVPTYETSESDQVTVKYYKKDAREKEVEDPIDADTYVAVATLKDTDNYTWAENTNPEQEFVIKPKEVKLEWEEPFDFTYNGKKQAPKYLTSEPDQVTVGYHVKDDHDTEVDAPVRADTYVAAATLKDTDNYAWSGSTDPEQQFVIYPKGIELDWSEPFDFQYDGKEHAPGVGFFQGSIVAGDDVSVSASTEKNVGLHVSEATLSGKDKGNYTVEGAYGSKEFEIAPKEVGLRWSGTELTYNGEEQLPSAAVNTADLVTGESLQIDSITAYGSDDPECTGEAVRSIDADGYYAKAELPANSNYKIKTSDAIKPFIIGKKSVTLHWSGGPYTYNAKTQKPDLRSGELDFVNVRYKIRNGEEVFSPEPRAAGNYTAFAELTDTNNYEFAIGTELQYDFTIKPYPVNVRFYDNSFVYDGTEHQPAAELTTVFDEDDCEPDVTVTGKYAESGKAIHAGTYYAEVKAQFTGGEIEPGAGIKGEGRWNYVLKKDSYSAQFRVEPKRVELSWFRPAYNAYGDIQEGAALVQTDEPRLVFNGRKQAPTARVKEDELEHYNGAAEKDSCEVTVSCPSDAIEAGEHKAEEVSASNPDYMVESSGIAYKIVARPVKLRWDTVQAVYNGEEQDGAVTITNIQKNAKGKPFVNDEGVTCEVNVKYSDGHHFGKNGQDGDEEPYDPTKPAASPAGGTLIPADRTPVDAGTYTMNAEDLTDPYNYTCWLLDPETMLPTNEQVAGIESLYTIHQYQIETICWAGTVVTYNASSQIPEVTAGDLQGPDTDDDCRMVLLGGPLSEDQLTLSAENADISKNKALQAIGTVPEFETDPPVSKAFQALRTDSGADDRAFQALSSILEYEGECNAGLYGILVMDKAGDRVMNYRFNLDRASEAGYGWQYFTVNKKDLTITANASSVLYGSEPANNGVTYSGLINGAVNTTDQLADGTPGTYVDNDGKVTDVVTGKLTYTYNYEKYGKPGKYSISAGGADSGNYAVTYKAGTLTVNDKINKLFVRTKAKGATKGKMTWNKVTGAKKYVIYWSPSDTNKKKYKPKKIATVGAGTTKYMRKKLKKHRFYKYHVVALDENGKKIAKSPEGRFCTGNVHKKHTNPKTLTPSKKAVSLKVGESFVLHAKLTKVKKNKKLVNSTNKRKLRYYTANRKVATIDHRTGKIKGVSKGWTRVYVVSADGMWKAVEVTVK